MFDIRVSLVVVDNFILRSECWMYEVYIRIYLCLEMSRNLLSIVLLVEMMSNVYLISWNSHCAQSLPWDCHSWRLYLHRTRQERRVTLFMPWTASFVSSFCTCFYATPELISRSSPLPFLHEYQCNGDSSMCFFRIRPFTFLTERESISILCVWSVAIMFYFNPFLSFSNVQLQSYSRVFFRLRRKLDFATVEFYGQSAVKSRASISIGLKSAWKVWSRFG